MISGLRLRVSQVISPFCNRCRTMQGPGTEILGCLGLDFSQGICGYLNRETQQLLKGNWASIHIIPIFFPHNLFLLSLESPYIGPKIPVFFSLRD